MSKTRNILDRYERMIELKGERYSTDGGAQYAYKSGSLMSEIRILAYRYPEVVDDLERIVSAWEKNYVVDVLSNDAKV